MQYNQLKTLFKCSLLTLFFLFITSCSSPKVSKPKPKETTQEVETSQITVTAEKLIAQAKDTSPEQAIPLLLQACQIYLSEEKPNQALWLASQLVPIAGNKELYQLYLIQAQSLYQLEQIGFSQEKLELAEAEALDNNITYTLPYYQLKTLIEQQHNNTITSVDAQLHAFALNPESSTDEIETIWLKLSRLSDWQIQQLSKLKPPHFKGWLQLLNYAHKFGANNQQFNRYLVQWQTQFPNHPAQSLLTSLQRSDVPIALENNQLNTSSLTNMLVLLPLSGKQKLAGEAAQQGILSAYNNSTGIKLSFVDSQTLDFNSLEQLISEQNINYVIGPLLKNNVEKYLAQDVLTVPTLLLNLPSQQELKDYQFALSMRPEDEAFQAASILSQKNFKHPLILSQNDRVSQRITKTFVDRWQQLTHEKPEVVTFSAGGQMQKDVQNSLAVEKSQTRITQLNARIKETLKTEARNRRDIDMIYLIGNNQVTRLIKPYIDVSISPFANTIPIYASSRSNNSKVDKDALRDLSGLTFSEMPWFLNSKQQNRNLKKLSQTLWPERSDSLQRIFAMGYDSLALIQKLIDMKSHPYIRHYGQTGVLKLNETNVLTRSLLWGRYQKSKVQEVVME